MENLIHIDLFGQTYAFKSGPDMARANIAVQKLLDEVTKVQERHATEVIPMSKTAILISAALNIADQGVELDVAESVILQELAVRSHRLARLLDSAIS